MESIGWELVNVDDGVVLNAAAEHSADFSVPLFHLGHAGQLKKGHTWSIKARVVNTISLHKIPYKQLEYEQEFNIRV